MDKAEREKAGAKEELACEDAVRSGLDGRAGSQFDDVECEDTVPPHDVPEEGDQ